jgi:hypothetical protein
MPFMKNAYQDGALAKPAVHRAARWVRFVYALRGMSASLNSGISQRLRVFVEKNVSRHDASRVPEK